MTEESSLSLMARARAGDVDALNILAARYLPRMRRWMTGRLPAWARDLSGTDDVIQEALLATLRAMPAFEPRHEAAIGVYLRQAAMSRLLNEVRRARRRPMMAPLDAADVQSPVGMSPSSRAATRERWQEYERALARLSPEDREAIIGRLEMDYSYRELAASLGKPSADAARKAVERALIRLAELLR